MSDRHLTRRQALGAAGRMLAGPVAGPTLADVQTNPAPAVQLPAAGPVRLAPRADLVNTLEYEEQAKLKLAPAVYSLVAGGDRADFDRITLRPRMLVPTLDLNLSVTLFGDKLFAPIIVGPIVDQRRFHADGELATVKGASAANAVMVVSSHSSVPLEELAAQARTPLWYQVFARDAAARTQIQAAVNARCKAICITVGAAPAARGGRVAATAAKPDWAAVDALTRGLSVPMLVKGIATPEAARLALRHGVHGIIVSNYGGLVMPRTDALILTLPHIVDAVDGKVPVLVDGSFRRGTDILKALAFGAQGVLVGRPAMWGLAAYGADGVQGVVEMLQTELARYMGMCGKSHIGMLDRSILRVHNVLPIKRAAARPRPAIRGPRRAFSARWGGISGRRLEEIRRG
jgi:4-hydroxymandelate oxidase